MSKYFKDMDLNNLWKESGYYAEKCTGAPLTDEMVAEAEKKLGYKLPQAYIELMKIQNGGKLRRNVWKHEDVDKTTVYEVVTEAFYSIGSEKDLSLFGEFSNEFWYNEWEYPRNVGVIIAETISGGHDMIYLDYRECGKDGEPRVSVCFQESDYEIVVLANSFEEFISKLITEEELDKLYES